MSRSPKIFTRRALLGVAALGVATSLAGCNLLPAGSGSGSGSGDGDGEKVTLSLWGALAPETGTQALLDAFTEETGIEVEYTQFTNDEPGNLKLDTSLTGSVPIDVYFTYNGPALFFQRVDNGLALDLTDRIASDPDFAQFAPDAEPAGNFSRDGKAYGLPAQYSPQMVYINGDALEEAGIELGDTWTTDDYIDVARKLKTDTRFGALSGPPLARPALGPNWLYKEDGTSNFEDPWFAKELEQNLALQEEGVVMDQETIIAEQLSMYSQNAFIGGKVAMLTQAGQILRSINDTAEYPHDFKTVIMPIPTPTGVDQGWNTGQPSDLAAINPKSKHQDEAWELVSFWMKNAAEYLIPAGRLPSMKGESTGDEILAQLLGPDADELYDVESVRNTLFGGSAPLPIDTTFTAGAEIKAIQSTLTEEVMLGDRTVESWVSEATAQANAAIAKAE